MLHLGFENVQTSAQRYSDKNDNFYASVILQCSKVMMVMNQQRVRFLPFSIHSIAVRVRSKHLPFIVHVSTSMASFVSRRGTSIQHNSARGRSKNKPWYATRLKQYRDLWHKHKIHYQHKRGWFCPLVKDIYST